MDLSSIATRLSKLVTDNSPVILTGVGVAGMVTTAYLTGKATFKASQVIFDAQVAMDVAGEGQELDPREKFELVWRLYVPAAGTALITATAIICATRIGTRRAAAMAAAYALSEKALVEYKDKVIEKIGANKAREIRDELAQSHVTANPIGTREIVITTGGDVLCYESFTGRYFKSDIESLRKAQNSLNHQVLNDYYASLTDFYNLVGLASTSYSDEVGWNSDKLLDLEFSTTMAENGQPCIVVGFAVTPIRGYNRIN
jgi:hypothetical protein